MENEELKRLYVFLVRCTGKIRACFGESCYAYGEIYADIVLGALVGAIKDEKMRHAMLDMALEDNIKRGEAMCSALNRREFMEKAMTASLKRGPAAAVFGLFGVSENVQTADKIEEVTAELIEYVSKCGD